MMIQGVKHMTDFEAKKAILDIGKRMYDKGFVASNDGNISCKVGTNAIWTTPTGCLKRFYDPGYAGKDGFERKYCWGNVSPLRSERCT